MSPPRGQVERCIRSNIPACYLLSHADCLSDRQCQGEKKIKIEMEIVWDETGAQVSFTGNDLESISFYRENDKWGELSNFYLLPSPINYRSFIFPTSEHLYQSLKYLYKEAPIENLSYVKEIAFASTPFKAKILANRLHLLRFEWQRKLSSIIARHPNVQSHPRWNNLKCSAMYFVLSLKFSRDQHCRDVLCSTSGKRLIEQSNDSFWGCGKNGKGENNLGKLLCKVREKHVRTTKRKAYVANICDAYQPSKKLKLGKRLL